MHNGAKMGLSDDWSPSDIFSFVYFRWKKKAWHAQK